MASASSLCREIDRSCFALLFEIESYLRVMSRWELRGRYANEWLGILPGEFKGNAKQRMAQEREIGYLDPRKSSVLSYLNLSELKDLIVESALWGSFFKFYWPPQEVVRTEFRKLLAIRNKSAHFRPVTARDLRVAHRFAEDLVDWTRQYRRVQTNSRTLQWDSDEAGSFLSCEGLSELESDWRVLVCSGDAKRFGLRIETVGHHLAFSLGIPEGSADPDLFLKLMEKYEVLVTFCRVSDLADRFTFYVPRKHDAKDMSGFFHGLQAMAGGAGLGLSSEDVRIRFELAEWEAILPWDFEMSTGFQHVY